MSIFQFTHKHNTIAASAILGIVIGLALSPSKEGDQITSTVSATEIKMDYKNVQPWLDSIQSLPKDQQKAKLVKAIESQLNVTLYRAQRVLDEKANSTGSQKDEMVISILKELHEQCAQQLKILKDALAALDK